MKLTRTLITTAACLTVVSMSMPGPAFAGDKGKAEGGCSNPYTLMTYDQTGRLSGDEALQERSDELLGTVFTADEAFALFQSIDHNNNLALCVKLPDGWLAGNTSNRDGFVNLVDDKVV